MTSILTYLAGVALALLGGWLLLISGSREGRKAEPRTVVIPALVGIVLSIAALLAAHTAGRLTAQAAALDGCATDVCVITLAEGDF